MNLKHFTIKIFLLLVGLAFNGPKESDKGLTPEFLASNDQALQCVRTNISLLDRSKLPSMQTIETKLQESNFKVLFGRCPSGMSSFPTQGYYNRTAPGSDDGSVDLGRKELAQFVGSDGEGCVFIVHVYQNNGIFGIFAGEPYACREDVGCN